jgi:hypothetical protein
MISRSGRGNLETMTAGAFFICANALQCMARSIIMIQKAKALRAAVKHIRSRGNSYTSEEAMKILSYLTNNRIQLL